MTVYDIEVLNVKIGNEEIEEMLRRAQQGTVSHRLRLQSKEQDYEYNKKSEELEQKNIDLQLVTSKKHQELKLTQIHNGNEIKTTELDNLNKIEATKYENEKAVQEFIDYVESADLARKKAQSDLLLVNEEKASAIRLKEHTAKMSAITPGLIEAITTMTNTTFAETLAKNLSHKNNGFGTVFQGGFEGILELVKGSPLEDKLQKLVNSGKKIHGGSDAEE